MPMPQDMDDDQKEPPGAIAAACVMSDDNIPASECSLTDANNESDVYYLEDFSNKLVTKHSNFDATESSYIANPVCWLASSTTIDVLGLMHERMGHFHKRGLIECVKSKIINGLKIEDKDIRKFRESDKQVCDICARAKATRKSFKKSLVTRGKEIGDFISVDIAVFINCPSRQGYKYVATFIDHATKMIWSFPMQSRDEFYKQLVHLIDVDLHTIGVKIKHYHADGGAELISKVVIKKLQLEGSRYTWTPADTPELNSTSERKWRTLGEMSLSMLLRSGLPVDFWWDAYETATYTTIRLPTTTAKG
jgi:hypothetical protein